MLSLTASCLFLQIVLSNQKGPDLWEFRENVNVWAGFIFLEDVWSRDCMRP